MTLLEAATTPQSDGLWTCLCSDNDNTHFGHIFDECDNCGATKPVVQDHTTNDDINFDGE